MVKQTLAQRHPVTNKQLFYFRFLEDLPAAEQQKYQDEQLKKQVERRAALNGHLAYLNQHKTTGDNAQNSENKVRIFLCFGGELLE